MDYEKQTEGLRGEGVGDCDRPVMGSQEGMYCMVHWVLIIELDIKNQGCTVW